MHAIPRRLQVNRNASFRRVGHSAAGADEKDAGEEKEEAHDDNPNGSPGACPKSLPEALSWCIDSGSWRTTNNGVFEAKIKGDVLLKDTFFL